MRKLGGVVTAVALAGLASAAYQWYAEAADRRRFPPPGHLVDIGGRRLHLWCAGEGSPTVVIIPALGIPGLDWVGVQDALHTETTVCLVDRAGLGWSDPARWPRSLARMADELHQALEAARLQRPYVVVGHSMGGLIARLYCARHPDHAAALVLIDSSHEDQMRRLGRIDPKASARGWLQHAVLSYTKPLGLMRAGRDLGLLRSRAQGAMAWLPPDRHTAAIVLSATARSRRAVTQEILGWIWGIATVRAEARQRSQLPLTVISGGPQRRENWYPQWRELQDDLAELSDHATHLITEHSGHHVHRDDRDLVVNAIRDAVRHIRSTTRSTSASSCEVKRG